MKTQKSNLGAFAANELSKKQKKSILGQGDSITVSGTFANSTIILTTTLPSIPPGGIGGGNGDAKIIG